MVYNDPDFIEWWVTHQTFALLMAKGRQKVCLEEQWIQIIILIKCHLVTTIVLNFTSTKGWMVFCSTLPILSMNTTVNPFEKILSLCLHYWESCCLLNQIRRTRKKGRIITVSSPRYFSPGLRNDHLNHLMNPGNSLLTHVKMACPLIFNELFTT